MKKVIRIFLIILFAALLIGTFLFLWNKTRPKVVVYEIVQPKQDTIKRYVVATGKIEPRDEVAIKPQISGIISAIMKEPGDMVKKGDVIATVKVIPEMSALNSAESRVTISTIDYNQQKVDAERTEQLFKQSVVSREEVEKGRVALKKSAEELQNAKDNLEIIKNGISSRYKDLSNTHIRSTINGMILDIPVKVGNSVILSNTFNDGTTITTIADMSNMIFRGNVDETDVGKLSSGMNAIITVGAIQNLKLNAVLEYVSPKSTVDNGVIMFEIKAAVSIPDTVFIRSGYSANASVLIENREGIVTIPESCIEFVGGKSNVNIAVGDAQGAEQKFELREVTTGISDGINIEITGGLKIGEKIRGAIKPNVKLSK